MYSCIYEQAAASLDRNSITAIQTVFRGTEGTAGEDLAGSIIRSVEAGNPDSGKEAADSGSLPADTGSDASDSGQGQTAAGDEAAGSVKEQAGAGDEDAGSVKERADTDDETNASVKDRADSGKEKSGGDETAGVLEPSGTEDDNEKRDV